MHARATPGRHRRPFGSQAPPRSCSGVHGPSPGPLLFGVSFVVFERYFKAARESEPRPVDAARGPGCRAAPRQ
eukprot:6845954-Lingulodinium_polyedra.AAC.1